MDELDALRDDVLKRWFPGGSWSLDDEGTEWIHLASPVGVSIHAMYHGPGSVEPDAFLVAHGWRQHLIIINLDPGFGPAWRVEQDDPLTLEPSIACRDCGLHGFIQHGRWVAA
jgi:hypothetical protein